MIDTVEQILKAYNLPLFWDVIIIGDGSGGGNHHGIGWAGFLLDRQLNDFTGFCGGQSVGSTVSVAEIMAFWMPLRFHKQVWLPRLVTRRKPIQVTVFSDNEATVNIGNRIWLPRGDIADIWAGVFATFENLYDVRFYHVKKGDAPIQLHILSDQLSVGAREWMEQLGGEHIPNVSDYVRIN